MPILAVENIEEYYPIPSDFVEHEDVFLLRVQGDSMIEAGDPRPRLCLSGEAISLPRMAISWWLLVNGSEATVKRFFHEGDHIRLQPENQNMTPYYHH